MRIAHLVTGGELAGGQAVALRLARAARAAGHQVLIVSPTEGAFVAGARAEGFAVELVDVRRTFQVGGGLRLARLLRRRRVDVVHTHAHLGANVLGRAAGRLAGAAVVSHLHIENPLRSRRFVRGPLVALDNASARLCARLLAVSEATRAAFVRQGFPAGRIEVVPNGVDVADGVVDGTAPGELRRELGVPPDAVLLAQVGRLAPVKGQRTLLEAFARLGPRRRGAEVVLIGEDVETGGAFAAQLRRLAADLGVAGAVHFAGFRPDAADVLDEVDVAVLPSRIEGLPLAALEAMARGKPVVATAVGGTPEAVVDGGTGLLVAPDDVAALAAALERAIADPDSRRAWGEAGRRRARERFDAARMERRVLEVYQEARAGG